MTRDGRHLVRGVDEDVEQREVARRSSSPPTGRRVRGRAGRGACRAARSRLRRRRGGARRGRASSRASSTSASRTAPRRSPSHFSSVAQRLAPLDVDRRSGTCGDRSGGGGSRRVPGAPPRRRRRCARPGRVRRAARPSRATAAVSTSRGVDARSSLSGVRDVGGLERAWPDARARSWAPGRGARARGLQALGERSRDPRRRRLRRARPRARGTVRSRRTPSITETSSSATSATWRPSRSRDDHAAADGVECARSAGAAPQRASARTSATRFGWRLVAVAGHAELLAHRGPRPARRGA